MTQPRLMLFDLDSYGHHGQYILQLVDYWVDRGVQGHLDIVVPQTMVTLHPRLAQVNDEIPKVRVTQVATTLRQNSGGILKQVWAMRRHGELLRRYVQRLRPGHCLLMYFDHAQLSLATRLRFSFPVHISGIYFRPSFHYPMLMSRRGALRDRMVGLRKRLVLSAALRNRHFDTLFCLDPYVVPHIRAPEHCSVVHLTDGVAQSTPNCTASPLISVKDGCRVALFFGSIAPRKGIFETLAALSLLSPRCQEMLCLVVAGRIMEEIRAAVAAAARQTQVQIVVLDHYLANEEIPRLFAVSDLVLVPYPRHIGSSGLLVRAAAAGKPVLGSDYGLVGAQIQRHRLGCAVDCTKPSSLAHALEQWLIDPETIAISPQDMQAFAAAHTAEKFCQTIVSSLVPEAGVT